MESLELLYEFGGLDLPSKDEQMKLATKKNDWYRENILKMTPNDILPGVKDFLNELKEAGYKLAIGSSSKNAGTILEKIGYNEFFDAIIDGTKITNSKPDPEVFIKAAEEMNIKPENCVVFEDAHAGIEAARKANMKSVGIGNKQVLFNADIVVPDLTNINKTIIDKLIKN